MMATFNVRGISFAEGKKNHSYYSCILIGGELCTKTVLEVALCKFHKWILKCLGFVMEYSAASERAIGNFVHAWVLAI